MTEWPAGVTRNPNHVTHGYTVGPEWAGYDEPMWIVRQYGHFITARGTEAEARTYVTEVGGVIA